MKFFRKIWRLARKDYFLLAILIVLVYLPWRLLPSMVIRGDGFVYLISRTHQWFYSMPYFYTGFETSAVFFGSLFSKLFSTRMELYFITSLSTLLLTAALYYWMSKAIFTSRFVAFASAIFFGVSYYGAWDMYSSHCYCFFLERIIPVVFLIPSFMMLVLFCKQKRIVHLVISIILYFFAIGIAHFEIFITPAFFFYPLFWFMLSAEDRKKSFLKGLLVGGLYGAITIFFILIQQISESGHQLEWGYLEFFLNPGKYQYLYKMARQLTAWSFFPPFSSSHMGGYGYIIGISSLKDVAAAINSTIIGYAVIFLFLWKFLPVKRPLILTILFGTAAMFYLNALFNHYDVINQAGSSRYLYFPTFLLALFWAMVLEALRKRGRLGIIVCAAILIWYYHANGVLIEQSILETMGWNKSTRAIYTAINTMYARLTPGTLVVAPYDEVGVYESEFFTEQLGKKRGVRYMSEYTTYGETWQKVASSSSQVIQLTYDKSCGCVREHRLK